jgi:hypothetical protein
MTQVYKYLDPDRLGFLEDGMVRFTPPGALNDPYECLPAVSEELEAAGMAMVRARVFYEFRPLPTDSRAIRRVKEKQAVSAWKEQRKSLLGTSDSLGEVFLERALKRMNTSLGILSLSKRWNSALMWSHYTRSYSGFCVGFHREHDFFGGDPGFHSPEFPLSDVIYSPDRLLMDQGRLGPEASTRLLLTKSLDWEYEREMRKVAFLNKADVTVDAIPFKISLFKIPFDAVSELIVGHRAPPVLRKQVLSAASRLGVECFETRVSRRSFDVERIRVSMSRVDA